MDNEMRATSEGIRWSPGRVCICFTRYGKSRIAVFHQTGFGKKAGLMSNLARVAFMLSVVAPLAAVAQTAPQSRPATQPASQAPAAPSGAAATPAAKAAASQRFVTSENFYRPSAKPQPGVPAPSAATTTPATPPAQPVTVAKPASMPAPLAVRTPVPQPAITIPVPQVRPSQAVASQPGVMAKPAPATGSVTPTAVDYASGQLTVVAENAPLGFVLNMIAAKTGAVVDLAPELQNEPVVARLGPGPVREVLTELLDSPRIDYIVLGGSDEGDRLQRVVVRIRHSMGVFAMAPSRVQPKQEDPDQEVKLDPNGHLISSGETEAEPQLSQQQRMANWQKARESMRQAEIKQQAQERENNANGSPDPPAPPQDSQPANPPQTTQANPPLS